MTIEEKRAKIREYCNLKRPSCIGCPLKGYPERSCYLSADDKTINRNYNVLFGESKDPIKPTYYNDSKITPFDVIDDWDLNFYLGNAIKYIKRAGKKEGNSRLQDLKKAREYIEHEIQDEEARYD